ncbi:SEN1 N terminal-domain-containing protein [Roridomyces roridus]|uniref:SEN1 N terminal-domain-containing protein n=1 Tax=Roridomyces roridus TaxID=1738132 RepID=A0AAD7FUK5_9AGAR|nr:SEN1 N terminal-domain-containing protein [Roridomyces roridus]
MASSDSLSSLDKRLASLRDFPVDNAGASDTVLADIYKYLMAVLPSSDGCLHWFCSRATSTTIGAATFLIRLFAYSSPLVEDWRKKFRLCLKSCTGCVQGLQDAKISSKHTYFGAFSPEVLIGFYQSFEKWEATTVVEEIGDQPLAAVHPAISFRILTNLAILLDPQVLDIIQREPPNDYIHGWPSDPLPAGLLLLLAHESPSVRAWAKKQASQSSIAPMSRETFSPSHVSALEALCEALDPAQPPRMPFPFAKAPEVFWEGFSDVLRQVPPEYLEKGTIFRLVNGHLHDVGSHFPHVLDSFEYLTGHVGRSFWEEAGPEYPQVVFDSVKENASFAELLRQHTVAYKAHPHLSWCSVYLSATKGLPSQPELIAKMADFLCEELQHERFADARPSVMLTALNLFSNLFSRKAIPSKAMSKFFDIHASIIVDVAFSKSYNTSAWTTARHAACQLMKTVMLDDINCISRAITSLCGSLAKQAQIDETDIPLTGGSQLWAKVYQSLQPNDHDGMSAIVEALAQAAHLDILSPKPFAKSQIDQLGVNRAMRMIWTGLRDAFTRFTESSRSTSLLDFLRRPGVVRNVFVLLLSPIEDIQLGAQSLVGFAFDVDGRQDCYRALLENHPDAALDGLFASLTTFTTYAILVTEACSLAKHLVQYLQDVVEVLCTRSDGLLFSGRFLRPEDKTGPCSRLPALWNLLNKAITVIFKRTPPWANYFENEEMIIWMRDALIYGRELLDKFRVFETAANSRSDVQHEGGKLSKIGQQMADDLQRVLPELARWLRLSNEELLYQMFELLQSLLNVFHQTQVRPLEASLQKMTKHIQDARKDNTKSRLDESRLLRLENAIALFTEEPEKVVVQIEEPKPRAKGSEKPQKAERKVKPPARSSGKAKADEFFTAKDQQKLDSLESVPTFRRSAVAGPSKSRPSSVAPSVTSVHSSEAEQSSEDDDQEQESQGTLASLSNLQRSTKVKQPHAPQRQIKLMDVVQNPIQQRAERRLQAKSKLQRLKPDLSGLYKTILSWSYHHDGAQPSGPPLRLTHVPVDRFTDYDHYFRVFEPLLYLECWAQIVQSKEDIGEAYPFKINARQYVDDWVDIDMTYNGSVKRDWRLTESDVVLLKQGALSVLGKVEQYKTPMGKAIEAKVRCLARLDPGLALDTEWQVLQVFSLSTVTREYAALLGLTYFDLCPSILRPALPPIATPNKANVQRTMALYRVNEPQAVAISCCLDTDGFSLIQGPPGTGKTSTIVALVLASLANRSRKITAPNAKNPKPDVAQKILICAPSNAAIDEIAHRIRDSEAFKSKGRSIVRLGATKAMNQNVVDISLDQLVENKLDLGKDTGAVAELASLRTELAAIKAQRTAKLEELDAINDNSTRAVLLSDEITRLNAKRTSLAKRYDEVKDNRIKETRGLEQRVRKRRSARPRHRDGDNR